LINEIIESLEEYDEIIYFAPQSKTIFDNIAKKFFEAPFYININIKKLLKTI